MLMSFILIFPAYRIANILKVLQRNGVFKSNQNLKFPCFSSRTYPTSYQTYCNAVKVTVYIITLKNLLNLIYYPLSNFVNATYVFI